jgi:hypothetical protein
MTSPEAVFIEGIFGHLIGDYLLQPRWMALGKSTAGIRGVAICTLHALVYTGAVCAMIGTLHPLIIMAVALSHWGIDRWSLGGWWLRLIGGRTAYKASASSEPNRSFEVAFYAVVYVVVDNTLHLLVLWSLAKAQLA